MPTGHHVTQALRRAADAHAAAHHDHLRAAELPPAGVPAATGAPEPAADADESPED
jgi:hypothetical protein